MKRSIIFVFSILSTLTLITSCHRFDFEFDSRHSAPEVVDIMFTITDTFSEYVKYDLDIQFNQAYSEDFKIAVQHSYSTDTYINESGNNKLTISVEINKDDFEQNEDGIFVYHVAISALDKYGTPIGQVYDLELTYEHVDAILLDTTFNTALNDALDGYTELKFVANSQTTSNTVLFTDDYDTKVYAVKSGSCLEVHTLANLFVAPADCSRMFHDLYNLTTIEFNDCFDTSKVTDMSWMFWCCESLTSLDLSNFDTSQVTKMYEMFGLCKSLTSLDLSNFNTSQVTVMGSMFDFCESLTSLDLSNFDTSKVTDMSWMFDYCESLASLDLSNFNTSQVTDMSAMFINCESLTSLDLSNFDTSRVTDMKYMFAYCNTLSELDIRSFSFSQEPDITDMFVSMGSSLGQATIPVYVSQAGYDYITTSGHTYCDSDDKVVLFIDKEDTGAVDCVYLPDGKTFNNIITEALGSSTELKFVANSHTMPYTVLFVDDYGTIAHGVQNGNCFEIHTPANSFMANADCSHMFSDLRELTTIDFNDCFDTSQVTDMSDMFFMMHIFNLSDEDSNYEPIDLISLDLSDFNTSNVTDMSNMFVNCNSLTKLDLSNFDTSQVIDMSYMFADCEHLTSLDVSNFDTSQVTDMGSMFYYCESLASLDLSNFDTSQVTNMCNMFFNCESLTSLDMSNFNTSKVTNMHWMFSHCISLTSLDLSNFDTSKVTDMGSMFAYCNTLSELDIRSFSFSQEPDITHMFVDMGSSLSQATIPVYVSQAGYDYITTSGHTYCDSDDKVVLFIDKEDTGAVDCVYLPDGRIFNNIITEALGRSTELKFVANSQTTSNTVLFTDDYDTKVYAVKSGSCLEVHTTANRFFAPADCSRMFHDLYNLTTIEFNDCFDTSQVTNMHAMFYYCESLTSLDLSNFDTSKVTDIGFMFTSCKSLTSLDLSNFDTSQVTDMSVMFSNCISLTSLDLSNFDTSQVTNMCNMFFNCESLTSLDLSNFDTSQVTNMYDMFYYCKSLTSLDMSNFNTSKVTNMGSMFSFCKSLTSLDLSNFNTSQVTDMGSMFNYCESLASLDLSNFDTSQVTDMGLMFYYCESLASLDLSNFDTSQVTDMSAMFYYCESLTSLDLSNFNTSQVTDMSGMFDVCESLTSLDLSNFDTSRVTDMKYMFAYCNTLSELDISSFSFSLEPDIRYMFEDLGSSLDQATIPVYVSQAGKEYLDAHYTSYTKAEFMVVN